MVWPVTVLQHLYSCSIKIKPQHSYLNTLTWILEYTVKSCFGYDPKKTEYLKSQYSVYTRYLIFILYIFFLSKFAHPYILSLESNELEKFVAKILFGFLEQNIKEEHTTSKENNRIFRWSRSRVVSVNNWFGIIGYRSGPCMFFK